MTTPATDILQARYSETETEIVLEIEVQDIDSVETTDAALSMFFFFGIRHADGSPHHNFVVTMGYVPRLPPVVGDPPSGHAYFTSFGIDWGDDPFETAPVNSTVDLVSNRFAFYVPKANISEFDPHVGPDAVMDRTNVEIALAPCYPVGPAFWGCPSASYQVVGVDYAPQAGFTGAYGFGEPLTLWWHNETGPELAADPPASPPADSPSQLPEPSLRPESSESERDPPAAPEEAPGTPMLSTWGLLVVVIVAAGMVSRRRPLRP